MLVDNVVLVWGRREGGREGGRGLLLPGSTNPPARRVSVMQAGRLVACESVIVLSCCVDVIIKEVKSDSITLDKK